MPRALFVFVLLLPIAAHAVQVYRCAAPDGAVSYQDKPCAAHQHQSTVSLQDAPIISSITQPQATSPTPAPGTSTARVVQTPSPSPLPTMYACTRYDGQRKYLSDTLPAPYAVPLGAQGYPGASLDRAYGHADRLGMSAPEEARKPPVRGGPLIANAYVQVQDDCVPAPRAQVCEELQRRFDANHEQLRMAFRSDKPPLQAREDGLNAQLKGC